jgi:cytoskeletal protein RodZ
MNSICERCGAPRSMTRPGHFSGACERCQARSTATPTSNGEGSGLIDIRTMAAVLGTSPMRPATPLPSFRGLTPAGAAAEPAPRRAPAVRPSQTPLHVLLGVLVFGMVGLAGAVVHSATRTAPTYVVVEEIQAATAPVADDAEETREPEAPEEVASTPVEDSASVEPVKPVKPRVGPRPVDRPKPTPKPTPVVTPTPPEKVDNRDSVECLLHPETCATKKETPRAEPTPAPKVASNLPEKLESSDISDGTRAAKASAMSRCGKLAKGGEVVKIKLSITGPTGAVLSSGAEADGGNPSLANCAASELKAAQFKPVQKQQIGAVVTLKF